MKKRQITGLSSAGGRKLLRDMTPEELLERKAQRREYQREWAKNWRKSNGQRYRDTVKRYAERHPERVVATKKAYWANHKERLTMEYREYQRKNPEKEKERHAKYHASHREQRSLKARVYGLANKERIKEYGARRRKENPELSALKRQERRARIKNAHGGGVSRADWIEAMSLYSGICPYCGKRGKLSMDHITPLTKDGAHDPSNIVACCMPCNVSKSNTTLIVWMARRCRANKAALVA